MKAEIQSIRKSVSVRESDGQVFILVEMDDQNLTLKMSEAEAKKFRNKINNALRHIKNEKLSD